MRTIIIANGTPPTRDDIARWMGAGDALICADGGARAALALGLQPQHVIGDFDSLRSDELAALERCGARLHRHPSRKDETDLELALLLAVALRPRPPADARADARADAQDEADIVVLGALGGRRDHELANVLLLAMPALQGVRVMLAHGHERLFMIDARDRGAEAVVRGRPGDVVSLLPFGGDAHGITTHGLEYPLRNESLFIGPARGVSNVLLGEQATISLGHGMLLCVVSAQAMAHHL